MWRASSALAVVGVLQLLITIPTLILVGLTLIATKSTLQETKKATAAAIRTVTAAENAEKPHLFSRIDGSPIEPATTISQNAVASIYVSVENLGRSPAGEVATLIQYGTFHGPEINEQTTLTPISSHSRWNIGSLAAKERVPIIMLPIESAFNISVSGDWSGGMGHPGSTGIIVIHSLIYRDLIKETTQSKVLFNAYMISGVSGNRVMLQRASGPEEAVLDKFDRVVRDTFFTEFEN